METIQIRIPRFRTELVLAKWKELVKRAKRLKVDAPDEPTFKDVPAKDTPKGKPPETTVTIRVQPVKLAGWKFVASVDFRGGHPVVKCAPGQDFRFRRRKNKAGCDHCNHLRQRNKCFIVENEKTGKRLQVGSTCLKDFLGHDPRKVLNAMTLYSEISEELEEFGGGVKIYETLQHFLTYVAIAIKVQGYRSRSNYDYATADYAQDMMYDTKDSMKVREKVKAEWAQGEKVAKAAIKFAQKIKPDSVFLDNLKAIARNECYIYDHAGFAAYIVQHYLTNKPDNTPDKGFLGTVGERLTITAKVEDVRSFESYYGYTKMIKFRDSAGRVIVWFTSPGVEAEHGKEYTFKATIKGHATYKGKSQTSVTRCKIEKAA